MPSRSRLLAPMLFLLLAAAPPASGQPAPPARPPREGPAVVRHLGEVRGWWVVETANFRVCTVSSEDLAARAARAAERARAALLRKWFGEVGEDWSPRCDLCVYPTAEEFSRQTGAPPSVCGFTNVRVEGGRAVLRRIELNGTAPDLVAAVLPHQVTHAVMAGRFGDDNVPQWANEGMAVLSEPRAKIDRHLRQLPHFRAEDELFVTSDLLRLRDYPPPHRIGAFYAQRVSLVDFLSRQKGPRAFTRFLRDGLANGFATALEHGYGWDFDELERRWRADAFGERERAASGGAGGSDGGPGGLSPWPATSSDEGPSLTADREKQPASPRLPGPGGGGTRAGRGVSQAPRSGRTAPFLRVLSLVLTNRTITGRDGFRPRRESHP